MPDSSITVVIFPFFDMTTNTTHARKDYTGNKTAHCIIVI